MKKFIFLSLMLFSFISVSAKDIVVDNVKYKINNDGTASLSDAKDTMNLIIPESVTDPKKATAYIVTSIEKGAFGKSNAMKSIIFNGKIEEIPNNCFKGCKSLENIDLSGVTKIGNSAFSNTGIKKAVIPASVKTMGKNVFLNCPIELVTFEHCDEHIDIYNIDGVTNVCFDRDFHMENEYVFWGYYSFVKEVTFGENLKELPVNPFKHNHKIEKVTILSPELYAETDIYKLIPNDQIIICGPNGENTNRKGLIAERKRVIAERKKKERKEREYKETIALIEDNISKFDEDKNVHSLLKVARNYVSAPEYSLYTWKAINRLEKFYATLSSKEYMDNYDEFVSPQSKNYVFGIVLIRDFYYNSSKKDSVLTREEAAMKSIDICSVGLKLNPGDPQMNFLILRDLCNLEKWSEAAKLFPSIWKRRISEKHHYDYTKLLNDEAVDIEANGYKVSRPNGTATAKENAITAEDIINIAGSLWDNRPRKKKKNMDDEMLEYIYKERKRK